MSISMGGLPSWTLWNAVETAESRGYLIVAAAGNYVHNGGLAGPFRVRHRRRRDQRGMPSLERQLRRDPPST